MGRNLDQADRYLSALSAKYQFKISEVKSANDIMAPFSRDDGEGNLNVHEMQTMWYEIHCGLAHYKLGEYRQALKQFQYIETHIDMMLEDCYDFHYYAFRKGCLNHYLQTIEFQQQLFTGRYPIASCINMLRAISKISKAAKKDGALDEMKKSHEAYLATDEYTKWKKEYDDREDDDEMRNDKDPEGWGIYLNVAEDKEEVGLKFARQVAAGNPKSAELQAKCLSFFISRNCADQAL